MNNNIPYRVAAVNVYVSTVIRQKFRHIMLCTAASVNLQQDIFYLFLLTSYMKYE